MTSSTLPPGKLAALAGLGPLGDLDLELVGVDQVVGGDPEAARGHLLDGAAPDVAVRVQHVARRVLAALAGVGLAAHAVHGDGEGLVHLLGDGAEGHRPGDEAADDRRRRARPRSSGTGSPVGLDLEQPAQGLEGRPLVVDERRRRRGRSSSSSSRTACWSRRWWPGSRRGPRRRGATGSRRRPGRPGRPRALGEGRAVAIRVSSATTSRPIPADPRGRAREVAVVTSSGAMPTASKIWAPQ